MERRLSGLSMGVKLGGTGWGWGATYITIVRETEVGAPAEVRESLLGVMLAVIRVLTRGRGAVRSAHRDSEP